MAIHAHSIPAPALHRALLRDAWLLTPGTAAALPVPAPILTAETVAMLDEIPQDDADLLAAFEHDFAALISRPWPEMPPEPLLPAESTATTANDASALASELALESTAPLLPLPAPLPSLTAALSRRRAIFGAVTLDNPDTVAQARALHMRRALEAAVEHGTALLAALGLPRLVDADFAALDPVAIGDALDAAISQLDALDAPDEDLEPWLAGVNDLAFVVGASALDAENDSEEDEGTAIESQGLGFVRAGADDAEPYLSVVEFDGRGDNWRRSGHAMSRWGTDVEGVNEHGSDDGRAEPGWFLTELDVPLILRGMMEDARRVGAGAHG